MTSAIIVVSDPGGRRAVDDPRPFWSSTDFPYTCLRDRARTTALGAAVAAAVRRGDTVIDAGAGLGILSLYAARAGAARVLAVENDPVLVGLLHDTVRRNDLQDVIEVVDQDVHAPGLPRADVVVMELIETGLVEEGQISAYNALMGSGSLDHCTTCVPAGYTTLAQPVRTDDRFYGFRIAALRHDWRFYDADPDAWEPSTVSAAGPPQVVWSGRFDGGALDPEVVATLTAEPGADVDAVRITGEILLADGSRLGDFASLNGPKIVPVPPRPPASDRLDLHYEMSAGFGRFDARWRTSAADGA